MGVVDTAEEEALEDVVEEVFLEEGAAEGFVRLLGLGGEDLACGFFIACVDEV